MAGTESLRPAAGLDSLYPDPAYARYVYEVSAGRLARIDAATWKAQWVTTIAPPPRLPGSGQVRAFPPQPQFLDGYTQVAAERFLPAGEAAGILADQVTAAVSNAGKILVSCTITPGAFGAVLLPHAGILLLPGGGKIAAYGTATGRLRWRGAAQQYQTVVSGDTVYASTAEHGGRVVAYDAVSGRRLWSRPVNWGAAVQALGIIGGIVYYLTSPPSPMVDDYALVAVRARDGAPLWRRSLVSPGSPPGVAVTAEGFLISRVTIYTPQIGASQATTATALLIDIRTGRLVASGQPGGHYADNWQAWSAGLRRPVVAMGGEAPNTWTSILTPARGYPAATTSSNQPMLAAVARDVAYLIADSCASQVVGAPRQPPLTRTVAGVDIRSGRRLWSVRLPGTVQCGIVPQLVPYDGGFAIVGNDNHVLLYR